MGFSIQGGHDANSKANAGDEININPMTPYGGGFKLGDINTGDKTQAPSNTIGGSGSKSDFGLSLGGGGGDQPPAGILLMNLQVYQQPEKNSAVFLI